MVVVPASFPRHSRDSLGFERTTKPCDYLCTTTSGRLAQPTTYYHPRPQFTGNSCKERVVLPSINELLRGIRLTDPNPSLSSDFRPAPVLWTPTRPPTTITDLRLPPAPEHRHHHQLSPSKDSIEEWEANTVCLGPNDLGHTTYQCLYDDPSKGLCAFEASKQTVKRHYLSVHQNIRPHQCGYCGKCFGQATSLSIHKNSVHTKKKTFGCPVEGCKATYSDPSRLTKHKKDLHGELQHLLIKPRKKEPFSGTRKNPGVQKPIAKGEACGRRSTRSSGINGCSRGRQPY